MEIIEAISPYFVALPLLIGILRFNKLSAGGRLLLIAITIGALTEIGMTIAARIWHNNMPILHAYTVLEFCLLLSVYHYEKSGLISPKIYLALLLSFIAVAIGNAVFYQGVMEGNSLVRSIEGIILIILALYYFFDLLKQLDTHKPERTFMFWVSIAVLVYFGGNLLIFIYFNQIQSIGIQSAHAKELMFQIGFISFILNIFLYTLYSVALLCKKSKPYPKSSLLAP